MPKHSTENFSSCKILGLLNSESGLQIIATVFVFSRERLGLVNQLTLLGKLVKLMIFQTLSKWADLVRSVKSQQGQGGSGESAHYCMAFPLKKPLARFSHFWINFMCVFSLSIADVFIFIWGHNPCHQILISRYKQKN